MRGAHLPPVERHHAWKEIFSPEAQEELLSEPRISDPLDLYRARLRRDRGGPGAGAASRTSTSASTSSTTCSSRPTGPAWPTRSRRACRSCDPVVAELALALDTKQKVRGFSKKRLLRKAVEPLLPREIVRGRKQGFSIPVAAWLRGDLEPFARDVLSPETIERQGYLNPAAVTRGARRPRLRQGGPEPPDLGAAQLHALVRPLRPRAGGRDRRGRPLMPDTIDALFAFIFAGADRLDPGAGDRVPRRVASAIGRSTSPTSAACTSSRRRSWEGWPSWWPS